VRRGEDRFIAGVCSGLASAWGVEPVLLRMAMIVLAVAGPGVPIYFVLWFLMPDEHGRRGIRVDQLHLEPGELRRPLAVACIVAGTLLLLEALGLSFSDRIVWPVAIAGFGMALLWQRSDSADRARWSRAAGRIPGRPLDTITGTQSIVRLGIGALLVVSGIGAFVATTNSFSVARQAVVATVVTTAGLALILAPWLSRLTAELAAERRERIRSEERADMAAHLHDSVLQTLALVQRNADRPREVAALARRQERELRTWLYGGATSTTTTLAGAIAAMASEVEELHGIDVDVVTVGDADLTTKTDALVQAAREATVNAAKHSGATQVAVYVEVEDGRVTAYVRDRGRGFDVDGVAPDRRGITSSIRDRMARHGGNATVQSSPGEGTEVTLEVATR